MFVHLLITAACKSGSKILGFPSFAFSWHASDISIFQFKHEIWKINTDKKGIKFWQHVKTVFKEKFYLFDTTL